MINLYVQGKPILQEDNDVLQEDKPVPQDKPILQDKPLLQDKPVLLNKNTLFCMTNSCIAGKNGKE